MTKKALFLPVIILTQIAFAWEPKMIKKHSKEKY
jgi:hypothetical protein